jgi:DDB1- and CUL4-associated factor 1
MFFLLAFPFQPILEEFDNQDGLRRVYNVISTMELLNSEDMGLDMNEEEQHSARQTIRHVFGCLKRYFETHLVLRARQVRRFNTPSQMGAPGQALRPNTSPFKPIKPSVNEVQEYVKVLMHAIHIHAKWTPVEKFIDLGGISLLLKVIAYSYEWNFSGRYFSLNALKHFLLKDSRF